MAPSDFYLRSASQDALFAVTSTLGGFIISESSRIGLASDLITIVVLGVGALVLSMAQAFKSIFPERFSRLSFTTVLANLGVRVGVQVIVAAQISASLRNLSFISTILTLLCAAFFFLNLREIVV